jgi:hypothetical protein
LPALAGLVALSSMVCNPTQNAYIESSMAKFRDESLNERRFGSLAEARVIK